MSKLIALLHVCIFPTDKTDMVWQYNDNNGLIIKKKQQHTHNKAVA